MEIIVLGKGEDCLVDDEDHERLSRYRWNKSQYGYAYRLGDRNINEKWKVLMHREVMNAEDGQIIDHKNGDRLDNRKENLRFVTHSQNNMNSSVRKNSVSKYKGVSPSKNCKTKPWRANIKFNHKAYTIGEYETQEEAAQAYNAAATRFHGEFARLNDF